MLRRGACALLIAVLAIAAPLGLFAEGLEFGFNGVRLNGALLGFLPVPTGADVELRLPVAGDGLLFTLRLAGGYEDRLILRDSSTGAPIAKPASFDNLQWFNWPNAQVDAGVLYRLPGGSGDISVFGMARGRYESNSVSLSTAVFTDANNLASLSFLGGLAFDGVRMSPERVKSGVAGELSAEYAPSFLAFAGGTDFYRASIALEGYLPLFSIGSGGTDAVSAYAAAYLAGDYAGGANIPLYVLTSFGGRSLRDGLGDSIRGYRPWGYEATVKAEASLDLRLVGPGLFGMAGLRPMAYLFGDLGWFSGLYRSTLSDADGLIASAGAGVALGVFDFVHIGARAGMRFPIDDPLSGTYFPGGEAFFWGITFLLHF